MALFTPDRSLLYPQFETYRLHPLDPAEDVAAYPLPGSGATQSRVGYNTHVLSFKETRARISFDHLRTRGNRGVYVDAEWNVIGFSLSDELEPRFTTLASLPQPVSSSQAAQHPEYPSVLALSNDTWAVATGAGSLYILKVDDNQGTGQLIARYDLLLEQDREPSPFLLQAAHGSKLLVSRTVPPTGSQARSSSTFELLEVELDAYGSNRLDDSPDRLQVNWSLRGGDLPVWVEWANDGWLVLSGEEFRQAKTEEGETDTEKEKRERKERVEKLGLGAILPEAEGSGATAPEPGEASMEVEQTSREWPFSWTQTSDSVSVTIPLPAGTTRKDIIVSLTAADFSLSLSPHLTSSPPLVKFLATPSRSFWTTIDPSTSTYSFNPSKSVLELELAKADLNTRWPSVFSPVDNDDDEDEDEEEDVPETLDPGVLASVRESFNSIKTRSETEPEGNHPAIPALLREEMDYDLEDGEDFGENTTGVFGEPSGSKVGRDVFVGHLVPGATGVKASWSKAQSSVVSLPLNQGEGIMVKSAVDGLRFTPPRGNPVRDGWKHESTSPALSFVLSSKRALRAVRHLTATKGSTVLAFDAGGASAASGNVYVYYPPPTGERSVAKQGVVRVSGADRGALLGTGVLSVNEKDVVVALCEKALVVLHGVV